jgi:AGZA family xanthine/uracil permease-like MFS transporter
MSLLERLFQLEERGSTVGREARGALATFLTMSYIVVANPAILQAAGIPFDAAMACTALAAGLCCLLMGLVANFPVALASGMGLNAVIAFQIAKLTGSWQTAMGLIVLDGLVVLALVLCGLREAMMHAIPRDLRRAIGAAIGLFIALIGLVNARLVVVPQGTLAELARNPSSTLPPVTYGSISAPDTAVAVFGLCLTAWLLARRIRGAIVLGIAASTGLALALGVTHLPSGFAWPNFSILFQADVASALKLQFIPMLLAILLVDFFDTLGTITAVSESAGLQDAQGRIPRLREILIVDSMSASIGGFCGASSVTCYIESAAGVAEGARTGLHSVFVGLMFLACILAAPVAGMIPQAATAPALILVGFLMCAPIARIDFEQLDEAIPAFITLVTLPFTYSITHGIGYGFITFVVIKVLSLKFREVHPLMAGAAALFLGYFAFGAF